VNDYLRFLREGIHQQRFDYGRAIKIVSALKRKRPLLSQRPLYYMARPEGLLAAKAARPAGRPSAVPNLFAIRSNTDLMMSEVQILPGLK
jgi:hypothetical protein